MKKQDLEALFTQLTSGVDADDADIDDEMIATTLQKRAHPVFQIVYDRGHGAATERNKSTVEDLEREAREARERLRTAEQTLSEERKKHPDAEQLREDHKRQIQELQTDFQEKEERWKKLLLDERRKRTNSDLKSLLTSGERRLDPDYAEVRIHKAEVQDRLNFPDEDSDRLEVYQSGKTIPLAAADGTSPLELLAAELKEAAPSKFVEVRTDGGSGSRGDSGSGGSSGKGLKGYKERLKKEREGQQSTSSPNAGAKRMGLSPVE